MKEEDIRFNEDDQTIEDEDYYIDEDGNAVIDEIGLTVIGVGNCDSLTKHKIGDWVPCATVGCNSQFQLRQWWAGVSGGNHEENEPSQDGGEDGLSFICYECAKDLYKDGLLSPESYRLLL